MLKNILMTIQEFDEKIAEFTPPWKREGCNIWCPLYMEPKDGYIGRTLPESEHFDWVWEDMQRYKNIYTTEDLVNKILNGDI